MKPSTLKTFLVSAIKNRFAVLITGRPGIGKSDIVEQATSEADAHFILSHPVVSDPTDYKGLPFATKDANGTDIAHFLPFGDLRALITADRPTVFFLDDFGQAPPSVQAACMQLLLAGRINGHKVSDHVTFLAATNRREDKAGVQGILEPVKSRFVTIQELEVHTDDWVSWAIDHNMPTELIAFARFKPEHLDNFTATKDMTNSASPRTVAHVGKLQNAGLLNDPAIQFEVIKGAAGEAFAVEYCNFLKVCRTLPDVDSIILNPDSVIVPEELSVLYALTGALAAKLTPTTITPLVRYLNRMPVEFAVCCMQDAAKRQGLQLAQTRAFVDWSVKHKDVTGL